jgi:regulator of CtrA degradation
MRAWRRGALWLIALRTMARTSNLSRPIIEALYSEALVLADEVRAVFTAGTREPPSGEEALVRLALSTEGLKTTTRMMHVLAWLLNQRALFSGELSESQVRLHGALPPDRAADPAQLALLEPATRELIADTERLHRRIARLDEAWRQHFEMDSPARAFQERIGREFGRRG